MAQHFNADDSDHSGSTIACACGQAARYAGRRPKTFTTLLGPLRLERAYDYCAACRRGSCPRDQALGLQDTSLSPATTRLVGLTAAEVSFAKASELLAVLAGIEVETRQVERTAEALGREVAADERAVPEQTAPAPAPTIYLGLDGTGVPVRPAEVEGCRGKQPDGSAKTREVKLVAVWTAEGRGPQGRPRRDTGSVSYNAAVESAASRDTDPQPAAFAKRVHREAQRRGFDTAPRRVVIGDGAAWIWNLAAEQFPGAIESSTSTTPGSICATRPRPSTAPNGPGRAVGQGRQAELDAGRLRALVTALRTQAETTHEARKCIHYVFGNRHRMRYPQFRAKGLCISSGVVEAGCKQIGARLKRAGMRWTVAGANAHPRPALLHPQRPLRGLLGATSREGRLTPSNNDVVHPGRGGVLTQHYTSVMTCSWRR